MSRIRTQSVATALLAFALFAAGCGGSSEPSEASLSSEARAELDKRLKDAKPEESTRFVGKVEGTDAFIGVEKRADVVKAYVCDSKQLAVWMNGTVSGDAFSAAQGPASLTGTLGSGGKQLTGSVTLPDGSKHAFSADLATSPAGLYEARAPEGDGIVRAGWVVLASGEQRGAQKVGKVVRPVTQVSAALTVALGGRSVPVIPPPGPVTNKKSYCQVIGDLFDDILAIQNEREAEGLDTTDQQVAINFLVGEMAANQCTYD